ncbi:MAG: ATP-binding protein [Microbacteriaceae bacterium]
MTEPSVHTLQMNVPPDDVDTVHNLLETVWSDAPGISLRDRMSFETALVELASNVIQYANAGTGVSCRVSVETQDDQISASLCDSGKAADVELDAQRMPDGMAESGRGIPLIQALVDELTYSRDDDVNHWEITRRLAS